MSDDQLQILSKGGVLSFYSLVCAHAVGCVAGGGAECIWDCKWDWQLDMGSWDSGMWQGHNW